MRSAAWIAPLVLASCAAPPADDEPSAPAAPVNLGDLGAGEGPVWHPDKGLYFTGRGRVTLRRFDGTLEDATIPGGAANGLLVDAQKRLVACQPGSRRVVRLEHGGTLTVLADRFDGKPLNSPNDLTVDSRGRIYFSDPRYGSREGLEILDEAGRPIEGVYRVDAPGQIVRVIAHEVDRPNGLLVSPNDEFLSVADNNNNTPGGARALWRFDLHADGSVALDSQKLIYDWGAGRGPDGLEMDAGGDLWVAGGRNVAAPPHETDDPRGGVFQLSPAGELKRFIPIPVDEVTNVAFGGEDLRTLFITAGRTLWSLPVERPGVVPWR